MSNPTLQGRDDDPVFLCPHCCVTFCADLPLCPYCQRQVNVTSLDDSVADYGEPLSLPPWLPSAVLDGATNDCPDS